MAGFYYLYKSRSGIIPLKNLIISGAFAALAVTIRFQLGLFAAGIGLTLLFQTRWREALWFAVGFVATVLITLGLVDYIAWGKPFFTLINYTHFNLEHKYAYVIGPWYNFILLLLGIFIIPVGFYLFTGFLRSWKKYALLFWPALLFLAAHSYFPNKQERFIIPLIPFFIILGVIGWNELTSSSAFWQKHKNKLKATWVWFWIINLILMLVFSTTYMKKNRVEPLTYLSEKKDLNGLIWESYPDDLVFLPKFYLGKKVLLFMFPPGKSIEELHQEIEQKAGAEFPKYIIFLGDVGIDERVARIENYFQKELIFEKKIEPPLVDYILHKLNPKNNINQTSRVYRIE